MQSSKQEIKVPKALAKAQWAYTEACIQKCFLNNNLPTETSPEAVEANYVFAKAQYIKESKDRGFKHVTEETVSRDISNLKRDIKAKRYG